MHALEPLAFEASVGSSGKLELFVDTRRLEAISFKNGGASMLRIWSDCDGTFNQIHEVNLAAGIALELDAAQYHASHTVLASSMLRLRREPLARMQI